jgi:hypothetical protein
MSDLPEITDVQRLTLKPGDRLVVRSPDRLSAQAADMIRQRVIAAFALDPDAPVLVLPSGISVEVVEAGG